MKYQTKNRSGLKYGLDKPWRFKVLVPIIARFISKTLKLLWLHFGFVSFLSVKLPRFLSYSFAISSSFIGGYFRLFFSFNVRFTPILRWFVSLCASLGLSCVDECFVLLYLFNDADNILVQSFLLNRTRSCSIFLIVLINRSATFACAKVVVCCMPSP